MSANVPNDTCGMRRRRVRPRLATARREAIFRPAAARAGSGVRVAAAFRTGKMVFGELGWSRGPVVHSHGRLDRRDRCRRKSGAQPSAAASRDTPLFRSHTIERAHAHSYHRRRRRRRRRAFGTISTKCFRSWHGERRAVSVARFAHRVASNNCLWLAELRGYV